MATINFTKEHRDKLMALAGEALISGATFKGSTGTTNNIYDLFHNVNIGTLSRIHGNIKNEIASIENLDEWSLTDYQQRKADGLKKMQELINLLIGFKRKTEEDANTKATVKELKAQLDTLKKETMTPEARIKELEDKIAAGPLAVEV
jgi:hypothetical protein